MHPDLEVIDGKTYTRPGTDLRKAEVRHMLNGFVSSLSPATEIDHLPDRYIPNHLAVALVVNRVALRMNYRTPKVGTSRMLLGRPVREDA